jgi:D-alanyl-lipoteichoic acid acyltransferase DltB (MBOAT superfamily)
MLFNSYPFLLWFLPLTLILFFSVGRVSARLAAALLALASLVFYGWWNLDFVPILISSVAWNFVAGLLIHRCRVSGLERLTTLALFGAILGNLGLLGYFKYAGFLVRTVDQLLGTDFGPLSIVLPIGISFFTFTQIAYLVDTARGEVKEFNLVHYFLFVTYFPHLIAGPILHHKEMMPQFARPETYRFQSGNFAIGIAYFAIGLAKKCILADSFAPDANAVFAVASQGAAVAALLAWKGALAYTLQLYFDFSGYIDMAIGLSHMFNIRLPLNFDSPYKATSIIEFWRRWHMTLSRFLRDYLYIPLGGNRKGGARRHVNLLITMVLGGLWHGANWTFVVWGALHGVFLVTNHAWRAVKPERLLRPVPVAVRQGTALLLTFTSVIIAWVFFRAPDFATAGRVLSGMVGLNGFSIPVSAHTYGMFDLVLLALGAADEKLWIASVAFYLFCFFLIFAMPNSQEIVEPDRHLPVQAHSLPAISLRWRPNLVWAVACSGLVVSSLMTFTRVTEFLYFQF